MGTRSKKVRARTNHKTEHVGELRRRVRAGDAGDVLEEGDILVLGISALGVKSPIKNGQLCHVLAWHMRTMDAPPVENKDKFWVYRRRFFVNGELHYVGERAGMIDAMLDFDHTSVIGVIGIELDEFSQGKPVRPSEIVCRLRAAYRLLDRLKGWNKQGAGYNKRLQAMETVVRQLSLSDEAMKWAHPSKGAPVRRGGA